MINVLSIRSLYTYVCVFFFLYVCVFVCVRVRECMCVREKARAVRLMGCPFGR